jgi:hypothetical protein
MRWVSRVVDKGSMRLFDACSKAAELTSSIYTAIYAQIDPHRIAESARGLEIGAEYAERILRRYRPEVFARSGRELIHRLVHAYPSHGFILDLEELTDLGLPVRAPDATEAPAVDALAMALIDLDDATEVNDVVAPGVNSLAEADSGPAIGWATGSPEKPHRPRTRRPPVRQSRWCAGASGGSNGRRPRKTASVTGAGGVQTAVPRLA